MISCKRVLFLTVVAIGVIAANASADQGQSHRLPMPDPAVDQQAFVKWQQEARGQLLKMLGIPQTKVALEPETRGQFEVDGVIIEKWLFTLEPGSKAPAVLYRPARPTAGPLPAIVLTFGHGGSKSQPPYQYLGQVLAKMNFICLAVDPIGEEERHRKLKMGTRAHDDAAVDKAAWKADRSIMGKMVFDTMRGVDFLLTRKDVDPDRLGVVGNSLGGAKAGWMTALDHRLKCAIISGWAFAPATKIWGKNCTRIPNERMRLILEWHEYLALAAPHCSVLIANGDADVIIDWDGSGDAWRDTNAAVAKAQQTYAKLGNPKGIMTWYQQGGGHRPYPAHPEVLAWLVDKLQPSGWTIDKVKALPRIKFGDWFNANGLQFEELYGTLLHQKGAEMADMNIRYLPPSKLCVLKPNEVGTPLFTIEGWLQQLKR